MTGTGRDAAPLADMPPDMPEDMLFEVHVSARTANLHLLRVIVSAAAADAGCSPGSVQDLVSAVDEACQNVIRHAYKQRPSGRIILRAARDGDHLVLHVIDFADPVDPATVQPRPLDELRPGGLGTRLIRYGVDEAAFEMPQPGAGNCLRMAKRIA